MMERREEKPSTFDPFSRQVLEFGEVLAILRGYLSGPLAAPLVEALHPRADLEAIRRDLALVADARAWLRESPRPGLGLDRDPREMLERVRIEGVSLEAQEILSLVRLARVAQEFRALFRGSPFEKLQELSAGLADFRGLLDSLEGKIHPDGTVDSSASPELARLRRTIERRRREVQAILEKLLERLARDRVLQDAVVTIRNERLVLPVRAEEKRRVEGVLHGTSSSGATVFLEPLETVPLNNELVELQEREFAEVQRILGEFSARLRERSAELKEAAEILSEIDLAFAKAEFARAYDACLPEFAAGRELSLREVRHPLLEQVLRAQAKRPVPLTLDLAPPKTMVVVSGPNTGGKTVALKTVGLAALMAQAGLPVAAESARLPLFERVLADIGDQQSIQASLSTFSAHVTNIRAMAEVAGSNDLVLLDELGSSTEPSEGAALAISILEHFRARGSMTFVTTHHSRLKAFAAETPEAMNAATEFDEATLQPTFRLLVGLPGKSSALEIAARLGLDGRIVARARTLLDPADAEAASLLARLHAQQAELERELARLQAEGRALEARRKELDRQFAEERRARLRELDQRLEETLRKFEKRWEATVAELRAQLEGARASRRIEKKAAALREEAREEWNAQVLETLGAPPEEESPTVEKEPAVGDRVRIEGLSSPGVVKARFGENELEVEVGRLKMRVEKGQVRVLGGPVRPAPAGPRAEISMAEAGAAEVGAEINLIGTTAEDARERVDEFLDRAFVAGRFRLRVIHGHGKGILRKTLHEFLASHPHVERFYAAPPQEGGTGATIVELKA